MGVALKAIVRPPRLPPSTPSAGVFGFDPVLPVTLPSEIPSEAYRILASLFKSLDRGHSPMRHAPGMCWCGSMRLCHVSNGLVE